MRNSASDSSYHNTMDLPRGYFFGFGGLIAGVCWQVGLEFGV
jgi:hypothetical protein